MKFSRARLRAHRTGNGLSRPTLAEAASIPVVELEGMEAGERAPNESQLDHLALALQIHRTELYCYGNSYMQDYAEVVATYSRPLSDGSIRRVANALGPVRT